MNKLMRKINNMVFDGASAIFILAYGIPVLVVIAVIVLVIVAVRLILRAKRENAKKTEPPESGDSSTEK